MAEQRPGEQGYLGVFLPVDASDGDPRTTSGLGAMRGGFFVEEDEVDRVGRPTLKSVGLMEPDNWRLSDLEQLDSEGRHDKRLEVQLIVDHDGPHGPGVAPHGQVELYDPKNRSTRMIDGAGRLALRTSHEKIVDAEEGRYAVALTCRAIPLGVPTAPLAPPGSGTTAEGYEIPAGVAFSSAGTVGGITRTHASVSIGGVTFFGAAAVRAARGAVAQGGAAIDVARAASAGARGLPAQTTRTRSAGASPGPAPGPDRNPGGNVPIQNPPSGYVAEVGSDRIGLLATAFIPSASLATYFTGIEGTKIGTLPLRHDVQVAAGDDLIGRFAIVTDDAAEFSEGNGRLVKGLLYCDTSRANIDTELGNETMQIVPAIRVDSKLPPGAPPPTPESFIDPRKKEEEEEEKEKDPLDRRRGPPAGGGTGPKKPGAPIPPPGEGPGQTSGKAHKVAGGEFELVQRGEEPSVKVGTDDPITPVENPQSQERDFEGAGTPCPNATSGVAISSTTGRSLRGGGAPGVAVDGSGYRDAYGWPALGRDAGGQFTLGGFQFGLPRPGGAHGGVVVTGPDDSPGKIGLGLEGGGVPGGVTVDPAPDGGVGRGRRVPGDDPGRIPLGLGGGGIPGGFGFDGPEGGDKGIPRGSGERRDKAHRRARARAAREARDKAIVDGLDKAAWDADDAAVRLREQGRLGEARDAFRRAKALRRAKDRAEQRIKARKAKADRRREWKENREDRAKARKARAREAKARKARKREERKARRKRQREERRRKKKDDDGSAQGAYVIETVDGVGTIGAGAIPDGVIDVEGPGGLIPAGFGSWNVANAPIPFMGSPGGAADIEGQIHLLTAAQNSMKQVVAGAFGGPSYLAANVGVVHKNRPGNPPAKSRVGSHWTAYPGDAILVGPQTPVVEFVSVLEGGGGTIAAEGGAFSFVREHRGDGIEDNRPLILLENARSYDAVNADMIADIGRRYAVDAAAGTLAAAGKIRWQSGDEAGKKWSLGRQDPVTQKLAQEFVYVDDGSTDTEGMVVGLAGFGSEGPVELRDGNAIALFPEGTSAIQYNLQAGADGVVTLADPDGVFSVNLQVDTITVSKVNCSGLVDPSGVVLSDLNGGGTQMGAAQAGFEYDATVDTRPLWKEDTANGDNASHALAYLSDVGAGTDTDAIHDNVAGEIAVIAAKAAPTSSDYLLIEDVAAGKDKKSITIGSLPFPFQVGAKIARTTALSLANGFNTAITMPTEIYDPNGMHSGSNVYIAPGVKGKYSVEGHIRWASNATGIRMLQLQKSVSLVNIVTQNAVNGNDTYQSVSAILDFSTSDIIQINGYQTSGGALNVVSAELTVQRIN